MCYPNTSSCVTSPPRNPDVLKSKFNLVTTSPSTEKKSIDTSALDKIRLPFDLSKPKNPNYSTSIVVAYRMLNFCPPCYSNANHGHNQMQHQPSLSFDASSKNYCSNDIAVHVPYAKTADSCVAAAHKLPIEEIQRFFGTDPKKSKVDRYFSRMKM